MRQSLPHPSRCGWRRLLLVAVLAAGALAPTPARSGQERTAAAAGSATHPAPVELSSPTRSESNLQDRSTLPGDAQTEALQRESRSAADWLAIAEASMARHPRDWQEIRHAYEVAAALGSLQAMSYVGWIHEHGHGTPRDLALAARWYGPVADSGADAFSIKLGWLYLRPELGADRVASEHWFGQAIARGSDSARVALASVWVADAHGGDTRRLDEAHALLLTALEHGHPLASRFLARIHVEGIGGYPSTPELRLHYTRLAANDGQALMQGWLARRYLQGDGVPPDRLEAAFWAALSAAGEDPLGRELHADLQRELNDAQRRTVMERTVAWALRQQSAP